MRCSGHSSSGLVQRDSFQVFQGDVLGMNEEACREQGTLGEGREQEKERGDGDRLTMGLKAGLYELWICTLSPPCNLRCRVMPGTLGAAVRLDVCSAVWNIRWRFGKLSSYECICGCSCRYDVLRTCSCHVLFTAYIYVDCDDVVLVIAWWQTRSKHKMHLPRQVDSWHRETGFG